MIDLFGNGKPGEGMDWQDSPFAPDYLSQADNGYDTIREFDDYEIYSNPLTRRRRKTKAPELFAHFDYLNEPMAHDGDLIGLGLNYGTSRRLTNKYNAAGKMERRRIKGEVANALAWAEAATPEQLQAQMDAVAKAQKYDVSQNYHEYLEKFPFDPQNHVYRAGEGLTDQEEHDYFKGTPEAKQAIIDNLNDEIAPWPAYVPTMNDLGMGAKDDFGYVAPPEFDDTVPDGVLVDAEMLNSKTPGDAYSTNEPTANSEAPGPGSSGPRPDDGLTDILAGNKDDPSGWRATMLQPVSKDDPNTNALQLVSADDGEDSDPYRLTLSQDREASDDTRHNSILWLQTQDGQDDDDRLADGGDDPDENARDTDVYLTLRYGNFGGRGWTNGSDIKGERVTLTDIINNKGDDKRVPIDALDALFMHHDKAYDDANDFDAADNNDAAKATRLEADLKLLARMIALQRDVRAGKVTLGIGGKGFDTRKNMMKGREVNAMHMLDNAIRFFTLKTFGRGRKT